MIFAMASLPWFIAIPVTLIVTILLGVTIERVAYRPLKSDFFNPDKVVSAADLGLQAANRNSPQPMVSSVFFILIVLN